MGWRTKKDKEDYDKKYYQEHKDQINKQNKNNYKLHRIDYLRQKWIYKLSTYGITEQDYNNMLKIQSYRCGICRRFNKGGNVYGKLSHFHVDHNHKTGKVRGLLCTSCNIKMGWYENLKCRIENYLKSS